MTEYQISISEKIIDKKWILNPLLEINKSFQAYKIKITLTDEELELIIPKEYTGKALIYNPKNISQREAIKINKKEAEELIKGLPNKTLDKILKMIN